MHTTFVNEFQLTPVLKEQLQNLLKICFPEADFNGKEYFKQLPHGRLLLWENGALIGQLSIDYRVMNLNGEPVRVMGAADVCVLPSLQGKGIGSYLMNEWEQLAQSQPGNVDFLFLVTDKPEFYKRLGYQCHHLHVKWLKIDQHQTLGIGFEKITDSHFMVKPLGHKSWAEGPLDMLGYMY